MLSRYNQIVLAIIGTIAILFLIALTALTLTELSRSSFFHSSTDMDDRSLKVTEPTVNDSTTSASQKLRLQTLTYRLPRLIDTVKQIYLIPVSQVNLDTPVPIEDEQYFSPPSESGIDVEYSGNFKSRSYDTDDNNYVVYRLRTGEQTLVFNEKTSINRYSIDQNLAPNLIIFEGYPNDSNNDGKLNDRDLAVCYIHNIEKRSTQKIQLEGMNHFAYRWLVPDSILMLSFRKDLNGDGEIDTYKEPMLLKKYDLINNTLTDLLDVEMQDKLQQIIDN